MDGCLAAYHEDWHMMLFDFASQKWTDVTDFPSSCAQMVSGGEICCFQRGRRVPVRVADRKVESVAQGELRHGGFWYGYAPDDSASLAFLDPGTQRIYALDVDFP